MSKYFVGLLPPHSFGQRLEAYRLSLGLGVFSKCPPHITVLPPFTTDSIERVEEKLGLLAEGQMSFQLEVIGEGVFWNRTAVLYLKLSPNDRLADLQKGLLWAAGGKTQWEYNPHITIAELSRKRPQEVKKVLRRLAAMDVRWKFICSELVFFQKSERGIWERKTAWQLH